MKSEDFNELVQEVLFWADQRGLFDESDAKTQYCKLVAEVGELGDSLAKGRHYQAIDDIGDIMVVLIVIAKHLDLSIHECLRHAYDEIKDRKGSTINGTFIKESDVCQM